MNNRALDLSTEQSLAWQEKARRLHQLHEAADVLVLPNAWDRLSALLNAGVSAVHEVDPSIKIVMHSDAGFSNADMRYFVDHLLAQKQQK